MGSRVVLAGLVLLAFVACRGGPQATPLVAAPTASEHMAFPDGAPGPGPAPQPREGGPREDPPLSAPLPSGPLAGVRLCLDPGHDNEYAPGAAAYDATGRVLFTEQDLTLALAYRLKELLEQDGAQVCVTRRPDGALWRAPRDENGNGTVRREEDMVERAQVRVDWMNAFGPQAVVSLHFNSFSDPSISGVEVYYADIGPDQEDSRRFAQALLDGLLQEMARAGYTPRNRGVRSDRIKPEYLKYAHLYGQNERCTDCTRLLSLGQNPLLFRRGQWPVGALVEALFLSSPQDVAFLRRPDALEVIANGLHQGIRAYFQAGPTVPPAAEEIAQVATARRVTAFTFDCGPWVAAPHLEAILRALEEANVRATFFVTGQFIERHPELFRRLAERHELANHSYSHTSFPTLSRAQQQEELQRTEELAQRYGYTTRPFWRAPHGARNPQVLQYAAEAGWPRHVFWSLRRTSSGWVSGDSGDWQEGATPQTVLRNVLRGLEQLGPGSVFVFHCGSAATAQVLPTLLGAVHAQGYTIVSVSALLAGE